MRRWLRKIILYTFQERGGACCLALLIAGICTVGAWWHFQWSPLGGPPPATAADSLSSLLLPDRLHSQQPSTVRQLFPFDPNQADSATLVRLGLPGWMARNIVSYRQAGGHFRRAEDFSKIYGMTAPMFRQLRPYITLPSAEKRVAHTREARENKEEKRAVQEAHSLLPGHTDTTHRRWVRQEKYPEGARISLNHCDTTELKKIPGIGSGIARRMVEYRRRLGGFYSVEQLREIGLDAEALRPWFEVDTTAIIRLAVNRLGLARLREHPYLNFYQAKALVEYRERQGGWHDASPLRLLKEFTLRDVERLIPYLSFE